MNGGKLVTSANEVSEKVTDPLSENHSPEVIAFQSVTKSSAQVEESRLASELQKLRKEIDQYAVRLRKSQSSTHDLECVLDKIHPKVYWGEPVFENWRLNNVKEKIQDVHDRIESANYILERYKKLIRILGPAPRLPELKTSRTIVPQGKTSQMNLRSTMRPATRFLIARPTAAFPPIKIEHLKKEADTNRYPKHVRLLMSACKIIQKNFKMSTAEEVIAEMKKLRNVHAGLSETANTLSKQVPALKWKLSKLQNAIADAATSIQGMNRLIVEGECFYEMTMERFNEVTQEYKELTAQNKALVKGIARIGEMCNVKSLQATELDKCADLLRQITSFVRNNPSVLTILQKMRNAKLAPAPKKDVFKVVDSTSSIRRLVAIPEIAPGPVMPFSPSKLAGDIMEEPDQQNCLSYRSDGSQSSLMSVPMLALGSSGATNDYVPGTRSTRRAFSALNSLRTQEADQTDVDQEMFLIGTIIGNIMVERFTPEMLRFREKICAEEHDYVLPPGDPELTPRYEKEKMSVLLAGVFEFYKKHKAYLHLLVFSEWEISFTDKSFLDFIAQRDQYISAFTAKDGFDTFPKHFSTMLMQDEAVACWVARDFVLNTEVSKLIGVLLQKMAPIYQRKQATIDSSLEMKDAAEFIPWIACFATFYEVTNSASVEASLSAVLADTLPKLVPIYAKEQLNSTGRAGMLSSFRLACFMPNIYHMHIGIQKKATSILHNFIKSSTKYPSCIKAATNFFSVARGFLDEETLMWHTALFYHGIVMEMTRHSMRVENLNAYLAVMTSVVANRRPFTVDQLGRLNFLPFMISSFHLEESVSNNKKTPNPAPAESPQVVLPQATGNVSYLDIPKLQMPVGLPSLNLENPKLQLHFQPMADSNWKSNSTKITEHEYIVKRRKYPIYLTQEIHSHFVQLMFATLIDHSLHKLDVYFCDPFPQVNRKPNVLYTLMRHMESKHNKDIAGSLEASFTPPDDLKEDTEQEIPVLTAVVKSGRKMEEKQKSFDSRLMLNSKAPTLLESVQEETGQQDQADSLEVVAPSPISNLMIQSFKSLPTFIADTLDPNEDSRSQREQEDEEDDNAYYDEQIAQFQDYQRLLRLTVPELFNPSSYANGQHIASGAFGAVMAVMLDGQLYAVKVLEKSRNEFDNPHLVEVFTEVSILEGCKGDRRVTQLVDYGCTQDSYYICMEFYPSTLKSWRKSFSGENRSPPDDVLLRLFREFLNCCTVLTERRVNHFDIKCDNVMLDKDGFPALADFGEAMTYTNEQNCYTLLNKGTEWIKSPEMLSIALNSAATNPNFDRRRKVGAGPASDVWSIGCLFYELITGEFLFVDSDWSRFFLRITNPSQSLLTEKNKETLGNPKYCNFLEFVLQRSVRHRPNIKQVIVKFDEMFPDAINGRLPHLEIPVFTDLTCN